MIRQNLIKITQISLNKRTQNQDGLHQKAVITTKDTKLNNKTTSDKDLKKNYKNLKTQTRQNGNKNETKIVLIASDGRKLIHYY